jgi:Zn-finger protein
MLKLADCNKCGDNDWVDDHRLFKCKSCDNTAIIHVSQSYPRKNVISPFVRREYIDGSEEEEEKAKEMEKEKMRDIFRMPPNCS